MALLGGLCFVDACIMTELLSPLFRLVVLFYMASIGVDERAFWD